MRVKSRGDDMSLAAWIRNLTWKCHVCGAERLDEKISVHRKIETLNGIKIQSNIRFCNDRRECIDGASSVNFFKKD